MDLEQVPVQEGVTAGGGSARARVGCTRAVIQSPRSSRQGTSAQTCWPTRPLGDPARWSSISSGTTIDPEALDVVSGTLAREPLLPPVATDGAKVRGQSAGSRSYPAVQPRVGALSALRAALERTHDSRTIRVVCDMAHEITRK